MLRVAPILLTVSITLWGSGGLMYVHNLDHAARDAAAAAHEHSSQHAACGSHGHDHGPAHGTPVHRHDETNCEIHAQLHMPLLAGGWVPVLVCLGLFIAFLSLLSPRLTPQRVPPRTDCRGPPAC